MPRCSQIIDSSEELVKLKTLMSRKCVIGLFLSQQPVGEPLKKVFDRITGYAGLKNYLVNPVILSKFRTPDLVFLTKKQYQHKDS